MNVIYQVEFHKKNRQFELLSHLDDPYQTCLDGMNAYSMPTVKDYAARIGADYVLIKDMVPEIEYINCIWRQSVLYKAFLFREFLKSDYDRFVFIDTDCVINDGIEDIFEFDQHKHHDFCIYRTWIMNCLKYKSHAKRLYNVDMDTFYNSGVFICNRKAAEQMNEAIPQDVLNKELLSDKFKRDDDGNAPLGLFNEVLFGYMLHLMTSREDGATIYPMEDRWNACWQCNGDKFNHPEEWMKIKHYGGSEGKVKIAQLAGLI